MLKKTIFSIAGAFAAVFLFSGCATARQPGLTVQADHADCKYDTAKDKKIVFTLDANLQLKENEKIQHRTVRNGVTIDSGEISVSGSVTDISFDAKPGWTLFEAKIVRNGKQVVKKVQRGVIVDGFKYMGGCGMPADFESFWQGEIAKMDRVLPKPELVEVTDTIQNETFKGKVRAWKFKIDCGEGNFATGYLAMPKDAKAKSLPAIAQFHGASTYGVRAPAIYYALHSINVVMSPHPSECGRDGKYYSEYAKSVDGYTRKNADNRDTYYMKYMVLRVLRTLQMIESLPEWDGKTLLTHGESQGGFQAIVGAALDKKVSFCLAMVPAMSDHCAFRKGYVNGWPYVIKLDAKGEPKDEFSKKAEKVMPYFDNVNFAKLITCEAWISTGALDDTCPPTGVFAVYNNLKSKDKHMFLNVKEGHGAGNIEVVPRLHSIVLPPEGM